MLNYIVPTTVPGRPEALRDLPAVLNTFTLTFAEKSHRALMRKKAVCLVWAGAGSDIGVGHNGVGVPLDLEVAHLSKMGSREN